MNLHQPFDPAAPTAAPLPPAAAPATPTDRDPTVSDQIVKEMVIEIGQDETFMKAASWARTFLLHAVVVALCFAAWAAYNG